MRRVPYYHPAPIYTSRRIWASLVLIVLGVAVVILIVERFPR